ncbi:hypothetical protein [Parahaliea mediterranea]|uniref:Uncharacterized protein n=1 Tax=Parahaliea mediterranea TaxID=651086 RepID=A0A939INM3_9GAMM|nr:hypothetical protein [Parahaliea mediterranea]MBN7798197.1 hypothetical protein [Parahaliea mediterranea]
MAVLLGLFALAATLLLILIARGRQGNSHRRQARAAPFRYRAVSIHPGERGCAPAQALRGRRFLLDTPPMLPLPECDRERCHCTYAHHPDRRTNGDRRELQILDAIVSARCDGPEQRHNRGRRRLDYDS